MANFILRSENNDRRTRRRSFEKTSVEISRAPGARLGLLLLAESPSFTTSFSNSRPRPCRPSLRMPWRDRAWSRLPAMCIRAPPRTVAAAGRTEIQTDRAQIHRGVLGTSVFSSPPLTVFRDRNQSLPGRSGSCRSCRCGIGRGGFTRLFADRQIEIDAERFR